MTYCSLGYICHSSQLLKINGLKRASYPFDWIFSNIQMIKHCIINDFQDFLDKEQYADYTTNSSLKENQCEHAIYGAMVFKGECNVIFNHINPLANQKDYDYIERCVNRFRQLMLSDEPKTFVIFGNVDFNELLEFNEFIGEYTNNHNLLVIQNDVSGEHNFIKYENEESGLKIVRIETISATNGVKFNDNSDDDYLNKVLNEFIL